MPSPPWWETAAIYQVYVRSFADGNGDGTGDLAGVRARLEYLAELGIDAIWFNPWYRSPMADGGYDVADYRAIDPSFGTLAEAEALIAEAHELGIRIIIDVVPNHGSDAMSWFQDALAGGPGSPLRERFWFRPGRGPDGSEPPNNWVSIFGGPAWTRISEADGSPGEWYLHLFDPGQPDLNWEHPEVRAEFESVLRFWFDRGVDGIRVDSAALLAKDPELSDFEESAPPPPGEHPFSDRDEVHEIYRSWRQIADSYDEPRLLIGEVWLDDVERFTRYLRPGELHSAFNFDFLGCPLDAEQLHGVIDASFAAHALVEASPTWVLSNHDVVRHVTRYGRANTEFRHKQRQLGAPTDLALGTRRARAAALLLLSLPGSCYVYQGEELGLFEVEDLPDEALQDPIFERSGHTDRGRDGCRVPLPWSGTAPPFGFSPEGVKPWLPQPAAFAAFSVEAEEHDPNSMLELYRRALALRRSEPALASAAFSWLEAPPGVLAYRRGEELVVVVNLSGGTVELPPSAAVLLCSGTIEGGRLASDDAVWLTGCHADAIGREQAQ